MWENTWREIDYRLDVLRATKGAHVNHLAPEFFKIFSTPCISNVNITGTETGSIMK
jgi:hypothetical protein